MTATAPCRPPLSYGAGLIALLASVCLTPPARAGDAATLNILGFSSSGSIFAYEEFGVQDGSGFPYAHRFYVDTETGELMPGTPIRIRTDDDTASVSEARALAKAEGETIISDALLAANRGYVAAFNPITELSADPLRVTVNPRPINPPIDEPLELRLTPIPFAAERPCTGVTDTVQGFRLVAIDAEPGGTTRQLAEDQTAPEGRGCPLGYRIGAVQTFFPDVGEPVAAILIAIRSAGFEGPDYRWLAITAPLNNGTALDEPAIADVPPIPDLPATPDLPAIPDLPD